MVEEYGNSLATPEYCIVLYLDDINNLSSLEDETAHEEKFDYHSIQALTKAYENREAKVPW
jgi:hypothetical protein